ncbi:MAG: helix-turn-helix domain-containing protein [Candidatus Omnitrophica bacterium]|nr:helix-turn-helix domain-containing protein [Candidatus Omnitrophota bacterium]MBU2044258.1 helix-turn-helix domain-containing protein [Candidatus Omnitrophota bacterium]MBU2251516.1 helix-turn-helix domain-containing protein [Candidatus Omnitrophota bacterium]MBU2474065.1 helix-turn-helix domain-containing protein [Candidatus Omnitrophota bacterium]
MKEKLLSTREVSQILGISEKDIIELANSRHIPHFKVAGEFLRFRRDDVVKIKPTIRKKYNIPEKQSRRTESFREFFYFNDFYILTAVIIIALLWVIFKDLFFFA